MGAKNIGDNVKILDQRMRAWSQVYNLNVSHVKGDLTINRLRESSGYPKLKATATDYEIEDLGDGAPDRRASSEVHSCTPAHSAGFSLSNTRTT